VHFSHRQAASTLATNAQTNY